MSIFGSGPAHTNGTRVLHEPAPLRKAEVATGRAALLHDLLTMPDFTSAPCNEPDVDPAVFFPIGTLIGDGKDAHDPLDDARVYCNRCDQADECLLWALETSQHYGIWGGERLDGLHAKTRRDLRDRLRKRSA